MSREFSDKNRRLGELISSSVSKRTNTATNGFAVGSPSLIDDTAVWGDGLPFQILGPKGVKTHKDRLESVIIDPTNIPGIIHEFFSDGKSYDSLREDVNFVDQISKGYCDGMYIVFREKRVTNQDRHQPYQIWKIMLCLINQNRQIKYLCQKEKDNSNCDHRFQQRNFFNIF